ncbi:helix-turn-helix domain-containing protein, partial [Bacteroides eggerthii]
HMLSSYLKEEPDVPLYFEALPIKEPLNLFLGLLETYLQAGVSCKHLHEIKERELFIIFRTTYTKREMIRLFHPIMGKEFDFKIAVLQHRDRVQSKKEMALLLGMSNSDLQRKFIQEFGETVSAWLQKQKNRKILSRLSFDSVSIKEIVHEFGFSSAASFNKYCKSNFGCNPTELRKKIKEDKIE